MASQLSAQDLKAIEAKIEEVERHTAGEIVVHVVGRSDDYNGVRIGWAVVLAALTAKVVSYEVGGFFQEWAIELAAGAALVIWLVLGIVPALLRWLIPPLLKQMRVHRRAMMAFVENGVHKTKDASGVLILVSMFEHRVEILADAGIHAKVGVDGWRQHIGRIIDGMKKGAPATGIVETIGLIGEELKTEVPVQADDENELSNEVVVSRN